MCDVLLPPGVNPTAVKNSFCDVPTISQWLQGTIRSVSVAVLLTNKSLLIQKPPQERLNVIA
jgi:hypothetical protein